MIKCKLGTLFQLANTYTIQALEGIGGADHSLADKFVIGEFLAAIGPTLARGQVALQGLVAQHGGQIKDSRIRIPVENEAAFNTESAKLSDAEVEIESLPLPRKLFEKTNLTVGHLMALRPFLGE